MSNPEPLPDPCFKLLPDEAVQQRVGAHILDEIMQDEVKRREDVRLARIEGKLDLILLLLANPDAAEAIKDGTLCMLPEGVTVRNLTGCE